MQAVPSIELLDDEDFIPFFVEPLSAWRCWKVCGLGICKCRRCTRDEEKKRYNGLTLRSITYNMGWPKRRPARAHCLRQLSRAHATTDGHPAPNTRHGCGLYSVKHMDDAIKWAAHSERATSIKVVGRVKIWGKILCYTDGYMSEYAYPDEICVGTAYAPEMAAASSSGWMSRQSWW